MEAELRNELDKLWDRFSNQDAKLIDISTRMSVADAARSALVIQVTQINADLRQMNLTLNNISTTLAVARGGLRVGQVLVLMSAGFIAWLAGFIHFNLK